MCRMGSAQNCTREFNSFWKMESIWDCVEWWMHHRKATKRVGYDMPVRNHDTFWTQSWEWEMWPKVRRLMKVYIQVYSANQCLHAPPIHLHLRLLASRKNGQKQRPLLLNDSKGFCGIGYPSLQPFIFWHCKSPWLTVSFPPVHAVVKSNS